MFPLSWSLENLLVPSFWLEPAENYWYICRPIFTYRIIPEAWQFGVHCDTDTYFVLWIAVMWTQFTCILRILSQWTLVGIIPPCLGIVCLQQNCIIISWPMPSIIICLFWSKKDGLHAFRESCSNDFTCLTDSMHILWELGLTTMTSHHEHLALHVYHAWVWSYIPRVYPTLIIKHEFLYYQQ